MTQVRTRRVEVRLDEAQHVVLGELARMNGLSVSALVRGLVDEWLKEEHEPAESLDDLLAYRVDDRARVFLDGLLSGLTVRAACRLAGLSPSSVYRRRTRSREFRVAWELAQGRSEISVRGRLFGDRPSWPAPLRPTRRLVESRRRQARLPIRLSEAEHETWQAAAAAQGIGLSELVRRLLYPYASAEGLSERPFETWHPLFIDALRLHGDVTAACAAAGISRQLAYDERKSSKAFAADWESARLEHRERVIEAYLAAGAMGGRRLVKKKVTNTVDRERTLEVWTDGPYPPATMALFKLVRPELFTRRPAKKRGPPSRFERRARACQRGGGAPMT